MADLFRAAALPADGGDQPPGWPAPPVGAGLLAEDERGRLYVFGADGLLRVADARAAVDAAWCARARRTRLRARAGRLR
jgi:hypothetical protein